MDYFTDRFVTDTPGRAAWLDKAGVGILEALGVMSEQPTFPAAWILGKDTFPSDTYPAPFVPADTVPVIAEYLVAISDDEFAARAATNEMDTDVEYLSVDFARLRTFYGEAAARSAAVVVSPPG